MVAYGLGSVDWHYVKAKDVFTQISQNKLRGVISLLALLETMDVIRKRIVPQISSKALDRKNPLDQQQYVRLESERRYKTLIDNLTAAAKAEQLLLVDHKGVSVADILTICTNMLTKHFGDIKLYRKCWQCRGNYRHYAYKGIGPIDAMHFSLAKKVPCDLFITTDKGFRGLDGQIAVSII